MFGYRKNNRGQTLAETALVLPIILLIIMGIVEFGRIFSGILILTSASREGARYGAVHPVDDSAIIAVVKDSCYTFACDDVSVTIKPEAADRRRGEQLIVLVEADIPLIAPLIDTIITNPFPAKGKTVMRIE